MSAAVQRPTRTPARAPIACERCDYCGALAPVGELARDLDGDLMCAQGYGCTVRAATLRDLAAAPSETPRHLSRALDVELVLHGSDPDRGHMTTGEQCALRRALRDVAAERAEAYARAIRGGGRVAQAEARARLTQAEAALARWATAGRGRPRRKS